MTTLALYPQDWGSEAPKDFPLSGPGRIETGMDVNPFESLGRGMNLSVPVWSISADGCSLTARRPVGVRIRSEGEFCFAENDRLIISGFGKTAAEALKDFSSHVVHFYRYYQNLRDDQVMGEAARLKQLFSDVFTEE